jgi:hypothetical protein
MATHRIEDGPDGKLFGYSPLNNGAAVRKRLPRDLQRRLYKLTTEGRVDGAALHRLLAWVHVQAYLFQIGGPRLRRDMVTFADRQDILRRFRRVAEQMRRTLPGRPLDEMLRKIEKVYSIFASPLASFPLLDDDGAFFTFKPNPRQRPPEQWRKRARKFLVAAGLNEKLTAQVVAAVAKDVAQRLRPAPARLGPAN